MGDGGVARPARPREMGCTVTPRPVGGGGGGGQKMLASYVGEIEHREKDADSLDDRGAELGVQGEPVVSDTIGRRRRLCSA